MASLAVRITQTMAFSLRQLKASGVFFRSGSTGTPSALAYPEPGLSYGMWDTRCAASRNKKRERREETLMTRAFDELLDFVTSSPTLEQIIHFKHSPETLERVAYLRGVEEMGQLTEQETYELMEFEKAAYFMEQLKIRAERRQKLTQS